MDSDEDESKAERMRRIQKCFLEMDLSREEREARKERVMKLKEDRIQKERQHE